MPVAGDPPRPAGSPAPPIRPRTLLTDRNANSPRSAGLTGRTPRIDGAVARTPSGIFGFVFSCSGSCVVPRPSPGAERIRDWTGCSFVMGVEVQGVEVVPVSGGGGVDCSACRRRLSLSCRITRSFHSGHVSFDRSKCELSKKIGADRADTEN